MLHLASIVGCDLGADANLLQEGRKRAVTLQNLGGKRTALLG